MQSNHTDVAIFSFEEGFDDRVAFYQQWMQRNWHLSAYSSAAYLALLYVGTFAMRNREPYNLRMPLSVWSSMLAVFSITGFLRVYPEFSRSLGDRGLLYSVCDSAYLTGVSGSWVWLFTLSKFVELGDTLFIVLRKQPLHFLHWFHHVTVLMYGWHAYAEHAAPVRWFVIMNLAVHSVMYSYYALRASRLVKIPHWIPMTITIMQIAQMMVGCAVSVFVYRLKSLQPQLPCKQSLENLYFALGIYASYLLLFSHFFYKEYLRKKPAAVEANGHNKSNKHD